MDHIVALALGGEDVDENIQGLCLACHAIKTALEDASTGGAANHPDWLRPASCRLTIVCGPPCAGKSTLVEQQRGGLDVVIDLDDLADRMHPGFLPERRWTAETLNGAIRARNALLGSLSRLPPRAQAWLIVSAPTKAERDWWREKLQPETLVLLDPGMLVLLSRAGRRNGERDQEAIAGWFERAKHRWSPAKRPPGRVAYGADGYPIEAVA